MSHEVVSALEKEVHGLRAALDAATQRVIQLTEMSVATDSSLRRLVSALLTSAEDIRQNNDFLQLAQTLGFSIQTIPGARQGRVPDNAVASAVAPTPAGSVAGQTVQQQQNMLKQESEARQGTQPRQHNKLVVLLAEEDEASKQALTRFLVQFGCQVDETGDGLEAVSMVERTKYDAILMSTVLASLDGLSASELIRRFDVETPIVALGLQDIPPDAFRRRGVSALLVKPFSKLDLFRTLSTQLSPLQKGHLLLLPQR